MMLSEWSMDLLPQQGWPGDEASISAFKSSLPWKVSRDFVAGTAKHLAGGLGGLSKPPPVLTVGGSGGVASPQPRSAITHDKQLDIIMPALGYGLSFPLSEVDVLRDCVTVYCDWLTALLPTPKPGIPQPILNDPNHYATIIISHFYYVFVPRGGEGADVNKQAVLCHRVLRTLQSLAGNSAGRMHEETWHALLLFLLHINAALLAPPAVRVKAGGGASVEAPPPPPSTGSPLFRTLSYRSTPAPAPAPLPHQQPQQPGPEAHASKDDAGEQLCERVLSVLFETWLLACDRCFPPPPLWTALRQGCVEWRHRAGLVQQWGRVCSALTAKLLAFMYGPQYKHNLAAGEELNIIPATMTQDCIAQVWFRLLHILGNPVELSKQHVISKTPAFLKFAISSQAVVEPCQHPCLNALPNIFLAAIKVVASLADAFLGGEDADAGAVSGRAKVNSVLHLFGPWLFEAALLNTDLSPTPSSQHKSETASSVSGVLSSSGQLTGSATSMAAPVTPSGGRSSSVSAATLASVITAGGSSVSGVSSSGVGTSSIAAPSAPGLAVSAAKRPSSVYGLVGSGGDGRKSSSSEGGGGPAAVAAAAAAGRVERLAALSPSDFEAGRAEALGALCRIFSSSQTGEEILPVYLARFYLAVREGLRAPPPAASPHDGTKKPAPGHKAGPPCSPSAAAVLLHGQSLFRIDLEGVVTLVPALLPVLAAILTGRGDANATGDGHRTSTVEGTGVIGGTSLTALRSAATNVLLSLLPLPLHFQELTIKEVGVGGERHKLSSLRPQLLNLLAAALQSETQAGTTHTLLGGLMFCVQDASVCEAMDSVSQHNYPASDTRDSNTPLGRESSPSLGGAGELSSLTEGSLDDAPHHHHHHRHHYQQQSVGGASAASATPPPPGYNTNEPIMLYADDCGSTLVVRAIYLVCHHLIASWRTDVNVSLAGLELLAGLARLHTPHQDWQECKRAVKWLCDYIVYQCSRPPQAHSKDLHSTIVAAFQTCGAWLLSHPSLLHDRECLATVLEVIELGISGAKSQSKGTARILKHDKLLKPASLRVRDAAEALLSCVLSQVGRFPASCGAELVSSQLDEVTLLQHCNAWRDEEAVTRDTASTHFRYYVSQNSILLALLEQPLGNHQEPQPSVTAIIRGPFGRSVWSLQLRHLPRHRSAPSHHASNPGRPLPVTDLNTPRPPHAPHCFPDSVDRIPQCKADKSIPPLESVIHATDQSSAAHEKLLQILDHQTAFEEGLLAKANIAGEGGGRGEGECTAPPVCQEFQTARLLLTHLGLLSLDSLQGGGEGCLPELVALDSSQSGFVRALTALDGTNNRSVDTVHVFYVAAGESAPQQILHNVVSSSTVQPEFLELLLGLGWPVNVNSHSGWTGRSPAQQQQCSAVLGGSECDGGGEFSGARQALYWCDASSEVAFLVPAPRQEGGCAAGSLDGDSVSAGSDSLTAADGAVGGAGDGDSSLSSHASQVSSRRFGRQSSAVAGHDHKIMVVWLESYADHHTFPAASLLGSCVNGLENPGWRDRDPPPPISIIFVHPLQSGLYRILLRAPPTKLSIAGPLVSGQVVSRRVLGALVRQTALNMAKRRRLDCDSYQPPHVRRKLRIQDMVQKFRFDMTEPEFYSHLFTSPLC